MERKKGKKRKAIKPGSECAEGKRHQAALWGWSGQERPAAAQTNKGVKMQDYLLKNAKSEASTCVDASLSCLICHQSSQLSSA